MSNLRRAAYLDAIGIVSYVSRHQLPGAAETRHLEIVPPPTPAPAPPVELGLAAMVAAEKPIERSRPAEPQPATEEASPQRTRAAVPQFNLSLIVAGGWLWLEELAGMPLASDQVRLVQAMARALLVKRAQLEATGAVSIPDLPKPGIEQFNWPLHNNHQLELDAAAARAGVAAFVSRRLELHECRGLVIMGQGSQTWVPIKELDVFSVCTSSTAEVLANPRRKQQVWQDLLPLVGGDK